MRSLYVKMEAINQFEAQILLFIREHLTSPFLDFIMPKITFLADAGWFWIALAVVLLFFKRTRKTGIVMGIALACGVITANIILKPLVARIRPYDLLEGIELLVERLHDFSFPSGHTIASFEGAVSIALTSKKRFGIPAIILAILIAFSRLYLFVHYPTDVLCGCLFGIAFAFLAKFIYEKVADKIKEKKSASAAQ